MNRLLASKTLLLIWSVAVAQGWMIIRSPAALPMSPHQNPRSLIQREELLRLHAATKRRGYNLGATPYVKEKKMEKKTKETKVEGIEGNFTDSTAKEDDDDVVVLSNRTMLHLEDDNMTEHIIDGTVYSKSTSSNSSTDSNLTMAELLKKPSSRMSAKSRSNIELGMFSGWPYYTPNHKFVDSFLNKKTQESSSSILPNKKSNELVTVADLESILNANGYVVTQQNASETNRSQLHLWVDEEDARREGQGVLKAPTSTPSTKVAFPKQSVATGRDITAGSTVSGALLGMALGITIYPNLWLVGMILGGTYACQVAQGVYRQEDPEESLATLNPVSRMLLFLGTRLANWYLFVNDTFKSIWFMIKTGQLSYDYYQRYAAIDRRFKVQDKLDAWNARFQQGKIAFDKWEHENEVGRKILAGLRTAWLVQEDSVRKERRRYPGRLGRYRIVQYAYNVQQWCKKLLLALWNALTGGGSSDLRQLLTGMRLSIQEWTLQDWSPRVVGAISALVACYCVGVMFAVAPMVLGIVAIGAGIMFPTWFPQTMDSMVVLYEETRAKGRGEEAPAVSTTREKKKKTATKPFDKSRYHYYVRKDGKRKWYRVGQPVPLFDRRPVQPQSSGLFGLFQSPTPQKGKKKKRTNKSGTGTTETIVSKWSDLWERSWV